MTSASAPWRRHTGAIAVPTLLMLGLALLAHATAWALVLTGRLPLWAGGLLGFLGAFLAFTPLHEAVHSNVAGRHARLRWLDTVSGWLSASLLLAPYPAYKVLHLRHHAHTNDPEKDPDYWVAGGNPGRVLLRCLTIVPYFYAEFLLQSTARRDSARTRAQAIGALLSYAGLAALLAWLGLGWQVLAIWILPGLAAAALLAFALDWLPHHPHDRQGRFHDTRVILFPGLNVLMMGHAFHLIHHLYPRVPFYAYRTVFEGMRQELAAQGAPISDWRPRLLSRTRSG